MSINFPGRAARLQATAPPEVAPPPPPLPTSGPAYEGDDGKPPRENRFTRIKTFQALRYPGFRNFFLAMVSQMGSQNMQMVVRAYLAFELTGSYAALGTIALANAVPGLALSMVGGAIADAVKSRKVVVFIGQIVNATNTSVVGMLLLTDTLIIEHLFIGSLVQGITMALMMPSRQSMIPGLVPAPMMMNAVALNAAGMNSMRLLAPALGGYLLAWAGGATVYFFMASLYLGGCIFLVKVPETPKQIERGTGSAWTRFKSGLVTMWEGVTYIKRDRVMGPLLLVNVFVVITAMPYMFLLAGFVQDVLGAGPDALGMITSISGIGSLAGALWVASMAAKHRGRWFLIGSGFQGLMLFLAFTLSNSVFMLSAIMLVMGVGQAARQGLSNVLVQEYVEEAFRGRVMSVYMLQFALSSFAAFITGMLAAWLGPRAALGGMSLALMLIAFGTLIFVPRLRNLD
ncbi:MAG: MFS transporter [Dehalococcoidia bacterium]|nr:MFS transporter [Dehalococcoidia bacterium]